MPGSLQSRTEFHPGKTWPCNHPLRNIDILSELPFYKELSVVETDKTFRGYAMIYKVELIDKKDSFSQSEASKSSIRDLFNDLLDERKGSIYQITVKVLLKKCKDTDIEFFPAYFISTTKAVINQKFDLEKAFQEIL